MTIKRKNTAPDKPTSNVLSLPFVADVGGSMGKRCFWHVDVPDNLWAAQQLGREYALSFLRYRAVAMAGGDMGLPPLQWLIADMPRDLDGVVVGFMTMIDVAAVAGHTQAFATAQYWDRCRAVGA